MLGGEGNSFQGEKEQNTGRVVFDVMQQRICRTPNSRGALGHHAAVDLQDTSQQRSSTTSCSSGSAGHQSAEEQ